MGRRRNQRREELEKGMCPLFLHYGELDISCRAHVGDAKWTTIHYPTQQMREQQMRCYCQTQCFRRCEHYLSWKHFAWEEDE